ncbi:MAG TPA: hypothetical protein VL442_06485 [Mucilaginibacter sp.]|nr:hypothetical protein [Mucilaginibacter sp.]
MPITLILKALLIIGGTIILIKKVILSKAENRMWTAFKIIGIVFVILLLITVIEFVFAGAL